MIHYKWKLSNEGRIIFSHRPVFRYEEFQSFMADKGTIKNNSCRQQLAYHVRAGHIIPIRRGLYVSLSPTETPQNFLIDLLDDNYLCRSAILIDV